MSEAMMTETSMETGYPNASKSGSSMVLTAGLWFFASPWVYGSYLLQESWNNWLVGAVIAILAIVRLSTADLKRTQWVTWINCLLAIWILVSPWIYQYADNTDRLINSVCVGVSVFAVAMFSAVAAAKVNGPKSGA
jgi:hypothetical protein